METGEAVSLLSMDSPAARAASNALCRIEFRSMICECSGSECAGADVDVIGVT